MDTLAAVGVHCESRVSVAVVDDDAAFVRLLTREILELGHPVLPFENAARAIEALRRQPVGVVLCDLRLPGMDGLRFAHWVRDQAPEVEFILMTADDSLEPARAAVRLGMADYLTKPFSRAALAESLQRAFERRRARSRLARVSEEQFGCFRQILDRLPQAIIVCEADGAVTYLNRSGREIIDAADALARDSEGKLVAVEPEDAATLVRTLAAAADSGAEKVRVLTISRQRQSRMLTLLLSNLPISEARRGAVLIFVSDPERRAVSPESTLQQLYRFTASEARLVALLLQGFAPEAAARQIGISTHTARVQLRRAFEKTGTGRQVDLVSLILSGPAVLSNGADG